MEDESKVDYYPFLRRLDPSNVYEVRPVSGGLVNETVRARVQEEPTQPHGKSVILKYAPPYVAAVGPSAPFSQERQAVEAAALSLFTALDGALQHLNGHDTVLIPELLEYDSEVHILAITDLGNLDSLSGLLSASSSSSIGVGATAEIGTRLGHFFAQLHSPSSFKLVQNSRQADVLVRDQTATHQIVADIVIKPLEGIMQQHGVTVSESKALASLVTNTWNSSVGEEHTAFIMGDAWTGSVLVDRPAERPTKEGGQSALAVCVIDWEFASLSPSGLTSDVASMLAHFRLQSIAARAFSNSGVEEACGVLAIEMARSYRKGSRKAGSAWVLEAFDSFKLIRNTCITIGRDMIYYAQELKWTCKCCGEDASEKNQDCLVRAAMVEDGVSYLRAASVETQDLGEFVSGNSLLVHLFYDNVG